MTIFLKLPKRSVTYWAAVDDNSEQKFQSHQYKLVGGGKGLLNKTSQQGSLTKPIHSALKVFAIFMFCYRPIHSIYTQPAQWDLLQRNYNWLHSSIHINNDWIQSFWMSSLLPCLKHKMDDPLKVLFLNLEKEADVCKLQFQRNGSILLSSTLWLEATWGLGAVYNHWGYWRLHFADVSN